MHENKNDRTVKVPFLDVKAKKTRFLEFHNLSGYTGNAAWTYYEIVDE